MSNSRSHEERFRCAIVEETGKAGEVGRRFSKRVAFTVIGEN